MEITLYVGDSKEHLKFFTDIFDDENSHISADNCCFGYCLNIVTDKYSIDEISGYICVFLIEFYLKEAVLSKIYDEYSYLDVEDASVIMTKLSKKIKETDVFAMVKKILSEKKSLNTESFVVFNLRHIMTVIYVNVDIIAEKMIYEKQKYNFVQLLKTYSSLNFFMCKRADVEFSDDNTCNVSIDGNNPVTVSSDSVLEFLIDSSPENINLFFEYNQPETANLIKKIFVEQPGKKQ